MATARSKYPIFIGFRVREHERQTILDMAGREEVSVSEAIRRMLEREAVRSIVAAGGGEAA